MRILKTRHFQIEAADEWWDSLTPEQQSAYLDQHPNSKYGKNAKPSSDKEPSTDSTPTKTESPDDSSTEKAAKAVSSAKTSILTKLGDKVKHTDAAIGKASHDALDAVKKATAAGAKFVGASTVTAIGGGILGAGLGGAIGNSMNMWSSLLSGNVTSSILSYMGMSSSTAAGAALGAQIGAAMGAAAPTVMALWIGGCVVKDAYKKFKSRKNTSASAEDHETAKFLDSLSEYVKTHKLTEDEIEHLMKILKVKPTMSAKAFLSRASGTTITADAMSSLKKDGCPENILKIVTNLSHHVKISHAQHEDQGGILVTQLTLEPQSDSSVGYEKVFSAPEMMELGKALVELSKGEDSAETYINDDTLFVEIYSQEA